MLRSNFPAAKEPAIPFSEVTKPQGLSAWLQSFRPMAVLSEILINLGKGWRRLIQILAMSIYRQ